MDPNVTLEEALEAAEAVEALVGKISGYGSKRIPDYFWDELNDDADMLASRVLALDKWLKRGGFLPERWSEAE